MWSVVEEKSAAWSVEEPMAMEDGRWKMESDGAVDRWNRWNRWNDVCVPRWLPYLNGFRTSMAIVHTTMELFYISWGAFTGDNDRNH